MPRRGGGKVRGRPRPSREGYRTIVIVCEGAKTEPSYFKTFKRLRRASTVQIQIVPLGAEPRALVDRAVDELRKLRRKARGGSSFDALYEVWAVFDRDAHPHFKAAVDRAHAHGIRLAVSNPCFELWGGLHFEQQDAWLGRQDAQRRLHDHLPDFHHKRSPQLVPVPEWPFHAISASIYGAACAAYWHRSDPAVSGDSSCARHTGADHSQRRPFGWLGREPLGALGGSRPPARQAARARFSRAPPRPGPGGKPSSVSQSSILTPVSCS